jgi:hypothetical protein
MSPEESGRRARQEGLKPAALLKKAGAIVKDIVEAPFREYEEMSSSFDKGDIWGGLNHGFNLALYVAPYGGSLLKFSRFTKFAYAVEEDGVAYRTAITTSFGSSTTTNYRATFFTAYPELEGKVLVHHAVEEQVLARYPGAVTTSQMHSLQNLRGIPTSLNSDIHLSQIRRTWNEFYRTTPNPIAKQLLDKAAEIDKMFGSQFLPSR